MSATRIGTEDPREQFWAVVRRCLRAFHKMSADVTRRKAGHLRKKIDGMPADGAEYFYHSEPFDVACEIAKNPLDLTGHLDQYLAIRDKPRSSALPNTSGR